MFISYIVMLVFWTFLSRNLILGVTYQKVIESRYIGHFLIICQIIDIIIHFLKLLVTLRNYRQNHRYQKVKFGIYRPNYQYWKMHWIWSDIYKENQTLLFCITKVFFAAIKCCSTLFATFSCSFGQFDI